MKAFRRLVEQHQSYAFGLAFRLLGDIEEAKDVTQESFVRVWLHVGEFKSEFRFTTWLYRIVVNIAYDKLRSRKRRLQVMEFSSEREEVEVASGQHPATLAVNRDLARQIRRLAGGLPPKQQMVFVLRDLQDQSTEEVGKILGMSIGAVKTNLSYARKWIREQMEGLDSGGIRR
jgi:RNA polymerase sigma-70 factor (ECF subfamily)